MDAAGNVHATALVIGDRGILVQGASGSGKTTLALALLCAASSAGRFFALVADDQLLLSTEGGRLVATAPAAIGGLVEVWGAGPRPIRHQQSAVIDLVASLAPPHLAPRYAEPGTTEMVGCSVPLLVLAERNTAGALPAILEHLGLPPFD